MRIASVEQADVKRNAINGATVIGFNRNAGMWQDPGLRGLWRQLHIKCVDVEGDGWKPMFGRMPKE